MYHLIIVLQQQDHIFLQQAMANVKLPSVSITVLTELRYQSIIYRI